MTLRERFDCFRKLAERLQSTNSIVEKRMIVNAAPNEMADDIQYIFEILAGQHKFGFTYVCVEGADEDSLPEYMRHYTIKDYLTPLNRCNYMADWSTGNVIVACQACRWFFDIVEPIVNRTLRLGIGKSMLPKDGLSAMLGKSYEGQLLNGPVYITEKLDGNRCIARWDGMKWVFTSRNGKPMKVNFKMEGLPKDYIYDGEVMSYEQTQRSINLLNTKANEFDGEALFNSTSGLINSKYGDKSTLVYNIFDIMADDVPYGERRELLDMLANTNKEPGKDWRIVPVLAYCSDSKMYGTIVDMLNFVTERGAEGLMINTANGLYQHKRTNDLLKFKKVQTMDMYVVGLIEGTGKYEGMVGSLECAASFDDGTFVNCQVGTGLSDEQRELWSINPSAIVGKIVEVAYFSKSQSKSNDGTTIYSLRFPRLKRVRDDKTVASKY